MTLVQRFDSGRLARAKRTGAGGIRVPASLARTGIQVYTDAQGRTIREYRPADAVFDASSLETLAGIPVTVGHPGAVDSANWRRHAVGHVSDAPPSRRPEGTSEWVDAQIVIQDADTIRRIDSGELVELSAGYLAEVIPQSGVTPWGERYDAIQRNVRFNHLALLPAGKARAGSGARLRLDGNEAPVSDAGLTPAERKAFERASLQMISDANAKRTARADAEPMRAPASTKRDPIAQAYIDSWKQQNAAGQHVNTASEAQRPREHIERQVQSGGPGQYDAVKAAYDASFRGQHSGGIGSGS